MKFNNAKLERPVETFEIPKTKIQITIHTIPVGFTRRYEMIYPEPSAPVRTTTDVKTGKVTQERNWYDEKYTLARKEWEYLKNIFMVYLVIKDDKSISFETETIENLDQLRNFDKELQESGLAEGDVGYILKRAYDLSNLTLKEIDTAKESF